MVSQQGFNQFLEVLDKYQVEWIELAGSTDLIC